MHLLRRQYSSKGTVHQTHLDPPIHPNPPSIEGTGTRKGAPAHRTQPTPKHPLALSITFLPSREGLEKSLPSPPKGMHCSFFPALRFPQSFCQTYIRRKRKIGMYSFACFLIAMPQPAYGLKTHTGITWPAFKTPCPTSALCAGKTLTLLLFFSPKDLLSHWSCFDWLQHWAIN